ncbi:MAG: ethanolamine utilization protein EutH [Oscillospiraceae bacterium]|nr:ethanolamine utilization protein EutH [Oscillospiraceae bacterium]
MSVHEIIRWLMGTFMVAGALDRIFGSPLGLGEKFEEGIQSIGALSLSMLGILALAPVLADVLKPVLVPVFSFLGADPAMFAGSVLANDMGGAPLATELAQSKEAAQFGGLIIGSMLGATIVFTIPVALGILEPQDRPAFAKGILAGIVTIPVGALVGGLVAGFPIAMILGNLVPIVLFALLIVLGLIFLEKAMIKGFLWFGRIILAVITVGLGAGVLKYLTGITVIPGMAPIFEGVEVVAGIGFVLAGAFPLVYALTKVLRKPLMKLGKLLGMNETAAAGMLSSLANSIPMFGMVKDMDSRGKVINVAFAVSAAFVFGDHLGFTAGYDPEMLLPVIVAKLVSGITAIIVALFLLKGSKVMDDVQ